MRPAHAIQAVKHCVSIKQPVFLHGSPGVGKSDVVRQVAKDLGYDLIDLRLSQLDPVDLRGVPSVDTEKHLTMWNVPNFFPTEGKGILFLDEFNSAAQATQAAAYQLVLDRKLGDYQVPDGWAIVAAGNRASDRAIVNTMSTALKNRFTHVDYDVNHDDWCAWALTSNIHVAVLGFIRFRPSLLNQFDMVGNNQKEKDRVKALKDQQAFATPRSWQFLSRIMDANPPKDVELDLYTGTVGEAAALELHGYLKHYRSLPDLDALIMNPEKTKVPESPATLYALSTGLAAKAKDHNFGAIMTYVKRMPTEFQVLTVKDAFVRDEKLSSNKAAIDWCVTNQNVVL